VFDNGLDSRATNGGKIGDKLTYFEKDYSIGRKRKKCKTKV